jgi:DNA-binding LacI/PurR family transcriptional regulator
VQQLRRQMLSSFAAGERVPSTRALASTYGVGAMTALRALRHLAGEKIVRLEAQGWVRTQRRQSRRRTRGTLRVGIISPLTRFAWEKSTFYALLSKEAARRGIEIVECPHVRESATTPARHRVDLTRVPWTAFDVGLLVDIDDAVTLSDASLARRKILAVDRDASHFNLNSVTFDNVLAGRLAAQHLLGLGHRRFAITDEVSDPGWPSEQTWLARRHGFEAAIAYAGGCIRPEWRLAIPLRGMQSYRFTALRAAIAAWKLQPPRKRPSAIFSFEQTLTPHIVETLQQNELKVPHDISIVSVSGQVPMPAKSTSPYTAIWLDGEALARRAFDAAEELAVAGRRTAEPRLYRAPALLIAGQSTSAPSAE